MVKVTKKKLPLTSDIVFKRVFSREGNEDILKSLLEAILEIPIQDVVVKNPELPRNLYDSKAGILDVKVEIDKDCLCDIEMQVKDLGDMDKRKWIYRYGLSKRRWVGNPRFRNAFHRNSKVCEEKSRSQY